MYWHLGCMYEFIGTTFTLALCLLISGHALWNGSDPDFGQVYQLVLEKNK